DSSACKMGYVTPEIRSRTANLFVMRAASTITRHENRHVAATKRHLRVTVLKQPRIHDTSSPRTRSTIVDWSVMLVARYYSSKLLSALSATSVRLGFCAVEEVERRRPRGTRGSSGWAGVQGRSPASDRLRRRRTDFRAERGPTR